MVLSLLALLAAAPVMVLLAILVVTTSKGPPLYRSLRIGRSGKSFHLLKFRSMVQNAEHTGAYSVGHTDTRVTAVGRVMRTTKLDELPQLINVLKGDMAIVGPRPDIQFYVNMYSDEERACILAVKPGLTDWATVVHVDQYATFAESDDPDQFFLEKIRPLKCRLQMHYVRTRSPVTDGRIVAWTVQRLLLRNRKLPVDIQTIVDEFR